MTLSIIQTIHRGVYGMSDEQREAEYLAQRYLARAVRMMTEAIDIVNDASAVTKIDAKAWEVFVHDEMPTERDWDEKISEARRR